MALGAALAVYGFAAERRIGEDWLSTGVALLGLVIIPIAVVQSVMALLHTIGRARLLAGENLLARWHVPAGVWRRSQALERQWAAQSGLANDLNVTEALVDRGVDVIVGRKSLLAGDCYFPLRQWAVPQLLGVRLIEDSDPACIEFHILYPRKNGPGVRMAVRLPFTREARAEAVRAHDYFAPRFVPRPSIALQHPRRTISVALVVSAIAAGAAAWGFGEAYANRTSETALVAAVVGTIVAPVALLFALATWLLARRERRYG